MDNSQDDADYSNSRLATLLADSYKDADSLRRELTAAKKRAEKAERLLVGLQTIQQSAPDVSSSSGPSPDVARMLMDYEDRITRAERARDDAEARRRAIQDHWISLERYLVNIELRAQDARAHYARIVSGDSASISLPAVPPYAHSSSLPTASSSSHVFPPLPPHPNPNPGRRPRTPSLDSSFQQPPTKRSRGDSDDRRYPDPTYPSAPPPPGYDDYRRREPRMVRPPGGAAHGRSRSRSSEKSISSVDEMLLQATAQESNGTNGTQNRRPQALHPPNAYPNVQQRSQPDSPPYPPGRPRVDHPGSLGPANQAQPYLFAPVVMGAPAKKPKYTAGGVTPAASANNLGGPIETPPVPTPPVAAFPPTNAEGQRICRQCGLPGRYKDGKCVEKWGPGPMGPGTVCDRCRKKMKRVERRGTLEQQLANANNALGRAGSQHVVVHPQHPAALQRSDTVLTHPGSNNSNNNGSQMSFRSVMSSSTSPGKSTGGRAMSPPPAIASLKEDDDHAGRSSSRSSSRNGRPASRQQVPAQSQQHLSVPTKRSPLASSGSVSGDGGGGGGGNGGKDRPSPSGTGRVEADAETDADAEAEVDADAEGDGDHEEYEIEDDDEPLPRQKGRGTARDADEDLLEAVDAAEANSNSSHAGGRRYNDDD